MSGGTHACVCVFFVRVCLCVRACVRTLARARECLPHAVADTPSGQATSRRVNRVVGVRSWTMGHSSNNTTGTQRTWRELRHLQLAQQV